MGKRDWDIRYLQLAALISTWSKDHAKVGAVLVRDNRVVGTGFNGFPSGVQDDERLKNKAAKQMMVVHAEENALLVAGDRARGAELYVYGKPVCARYAASIIQAKVSIVIAGAPKQLYASDTDLYEKLTNADGEIDWQKMGRIAINMFKEARVQWHEGSLSERVPELLADLAKPDHERRSGKERRSAKLALAAE